MKIHHFNDIYQERWGFSWAMLVSGRVIVFFCFFWFVSDYKAPPCLLLFDFEGPNFLTQRLVNGSNSCDWKGFFCLKSWGSLANDHHFTSKSAKSTVDWCKLLQYIYYRNVIVSILVQTQLRKSWIIIRIVTKQNNDYWMTHHHTNSNITINIG